MGINIYDEALLSITDCGKTVDDVLYYGNLDGTEAFKFDEFKRIYNKTSNDFYLPFDKTIVFKDGTRLLYMSISYYEDWVYIGLPCMNPIYKT